MATELELALFKEELEGVRSLKEAPRWQLERDDSVPLGLFVVMHPASDLKQLYKARLRWSNYFGPFSLKFVNMTTAADNDPSSWPKCHGFRPGSLDACLQITAEGHGLHPEWTHSAATRFPNVELPMQFALLQLQVILDNSYQGRGP